MTSTPLDACVHTVATRVARVWKARLPNGLLDVMYQDAVELAYVAAKRYDPTKSTSLEAYLYKSTVYKVGDRIARQSKPVTARANDDLPELRAVRVVGEDTAVALPASDDIDSALWSEQVRARMLYVTQAVGEFPLLVALGLKSPEDGASTGVTAVYSAVKKAKALIRRDKKLYRMLREVTCRA